MAKPINARRRPSGSSTTAKANPQHPNATTVAATLRRIANSLHALGSGPTVRPWVERHGRPVVDHRPRVNQHTAGDGDPRVGAEDQTGVDGLGACSGVHAQSLRPPLAPRIPRNVSGASPVQGSSGPAACRRSSAHNDRNGGGKPDTTGIEVVFDTSRSVASPIDGIVSPEPESMLPPPREFEFLKFFDGFTHNLRSIREPRKALAHALRESREFFKANRGCIAAGRGRRIGPPGCCSRCRRTRPGIFSTSAASSATATRRPGVT